MSTGRIRYLLLDDIRGITLISMMFFHAMWDIVYIFGINIPWYKSIGAYIWQQSICWTFIFLSGFCWSFGQKKIKRGLTVFIAGAIITLVTFVFMYEDRVVYGVLTLIGSCMLIMIILEKGCRHCHSHFGLLLSIVLFFVFRNINDGYLGFERWNIVQLPQYLYTNYFMTYLGFTEKNFYSTDYFSILPWIFLFIAGYFSHRLVDEKGIMKLFQRKGCRFLEIFGQNSLMIYMIHQPLIYFLLYGIFKIG